MNSNSRKMLLFEKKETVEIIEEEQLPPADDQVLIESLVSLVSPGTEIAYFDGSHSLFQSGKKKFPSYPPGHSNVGIIKKVLLRFVPQ